MNRSQEGLNPQASFREYPSTVEVLVYKFVMGKLTTTKPYNTNAVCKSSTSRACKTKKTNAVANIFLKKK